MRTITKALVYAVLLGMLMPWTGGKARAAHPRRVGHLARHEQLRPAERLRRWRDTPAGHNPVRPGSAAAIASDDDDDDDEGPRPSHGEAHERPAAVHAGQVRLACSPSRRSRLLPATVPLYQALCLLLI